MTTLRVQINSNNSRTSINIKQLRKSKTTLRRGDNEYRLPAVLARHKPNTDAMVQNLVERPQLNGLSGRVLRYVADKDRHVIRLHETGLTLLHFKAIVFYSLKVLVFGPLILRDSWPRQRRSKKTPTVCTK
jgi:hypothetical protein